MGSDIFKCQQQMYLNALQCYGDKLRILILTNKQVFKAMVVITLSISNTHNIKMLFLSIPYAMLLFWGIFYGITISFLC